ncbi:alginate lyase family protein [Terracidiphilus sp.]|jgi:poly(beta-D-mannuronate) lyase|uniref:alginate lyase family protein n=1 Tax=Terracidiphilus sp. TaxID=1964191 RepID=UPI003C24DF22
MRMQFRKTLLALSLFASVLPSDAQKDLLDKASVTNPSASFLDVAARRSALATATNPRVVAALKDKWDCTHSEQPAPPTGRMIVPHHYLSGSNGPVNPEEATATVVYQQLQNAATDGAGRYVATGDRAEATCVANLLARWAAAKTLLDYSYKESSQAWYQVEWTLSSISLAYSVVQSDPAITADQRKQISGWMHDVTIYMFDQDPHPDDHAHENNHSYWRALCATSVGVLTADNNLYRRGLEQYARAIGQMNPDGSLPLEMARHENALHYQSFALEPLVMIAELAAHQGTDLYSARSNGHTIADAVDFLVRASANLDLMKQYASEPQTFSLFNGKKPPAWVEFWAARHPGELRSTSETWSTLLKQPLSDSTIGGNATLYAAPAK